MAHYDCSCCGEPFGISHDLCSYCAKGKCAKLQKTPDLIDWSRPIVCANNFPAKFIKKAFIGVPPYEVYVVNLDPRTKDGLLTFNYSDRGEAVGGAIAPRIFNVFGSVSVNIAKEVINFGIF